tara:strand:+ start:35 stop:496 length:462 start_codon:yes stop_codon:yes gene_type:complete
MASINSRKIYIDSDDSDISFENDSKHSDLENINHDDNSSYSVLMSPLLSKYLDDINTKIQDIELNLVSKIDKLSDKIDEVSQKCDLDKKYRNFNTIQNSVLHENNIFLNNQIIELHKIINENHDSVSTDIKNKIDKILTKKISFDNQSYMTGV